MKTKTNISASGGEIIKAVPHLLAQVYAHERGFLIG